MVKNLRESVLTHQTSITKRGKVEDFLEKLDPETLEEVNSILRDPELESRAIYKTLKGIGLSASETTFRVYRRSIL